MEDWEFDFKWTRVRHFVKSTLHRDTLPNLNAILFLIGIQELGFVKAQFTKEEKQDLMHIAVCRLLSEDQYYEFEGRDEEGWPHWKALRPVKIEGVKSQEQMLKERIIQYFENDYSQNLNEL